MEKGCDSCKWYWLSIAHPHRPCSSCSGVVEDSSRVDSHIIRDGSRWELSDTYEELLEEQRIERKVW